METIYWTLVSLVNTGLVNTGLTVQWNCGKPDKSISLLKTKPARLNAKRKSVLWFRLQVDGPINEELSSGGGLWMEVYSTVHANLSLTLYFSYKLQVEKFIVH